MGSFVGNALVLQPWEEVQRKSAIAATGSPSPVPYAPIHPVPNVYTHVGHAAQYGRGRRNGRTVRLLILHITDVDGSALGAASYDARRADQVSATCFVGPSGELVYDVAEENRPYTTQRWNDESLAAEIVGHDEWSSSQWRGRPRQMDAITRLLTDWCKRYVIPVEWLSPTQVAEGASRLGASPVQGINRGITDHLNANLAARLLGASAASTSHICVGPGLRTVLFEDVLPEVIRRLAQTPTPIPPTPTPIPPTPTPIPPTPTPVPPTDIDMDTEEEMPFLVKKSSGETAVIYGSGKMTGLAGEDIPEFEEKFGKALPISNNTVWDDFANKGKA